MARHNQRYSNSRRRQSKVAVWPFVVLALVLFAGFFAIKALNANSRSSNSDPKASQAMAHHIPDLEIAKVTDGSRRNSLRKDYEGFSVLFNPDNHTPDWSGWELLRSEADGESSRSNNFWQDADIDGCPISRDYSNSGYDRGHLCPAADQKWSPEAMSDCFVMTNICPQTHALNGGAWQTLEKKERLWAERDSALVIVAGPIYTEADTSRIGETGVRVPSAFFKVLLAPYVEEPRAIGFIYPNMSAPGNMENYSMTVDEVEKITGLDFFSNLPDEIENQVESRKSFTEWNR